MMNKMSQEEALRALIDPVVNSFDCELWGIDYVPMKQGALLRIFIDKSDGVSIDDCSNVSRQVGALLDVEDTIKVNYTLEVSSTGIDKPLMNVSHYERYIGESIKVRLKWPIEERRNFTGVISSVENEVIDIDVDGQAFSIPFDAIGRGRLLVEI